MGLKQARDEFRQNPNFETAAEYLTHASVHLLETENIVVNDDVCAEVDYWLAHKRLLILPDNPR